MLGAAGAALTSAWRGGRELLGSWCCDVVPVLVFGSGAVTASLTGINPSAHCRCWALFLRILVGRPWAACAAIRVALD